MTGTQSRRTKICFVQFSVSLHSWIKYKKKSQITERQTTSVSQELTE